uniref:Transposase IS200-like domain-containing protein n=1 Tax=Candidatus Kentrum sp. FW TaxID=2126338 RepID=A0A450SW95_9GAMM|nr:MAG: hypothetical protein BECKFW1821A_GA0114235_100619 [Candidatus Kentron sp. FW]VFJ58227.1 MAG: hypothetical protein BECKFW1821B_GA0114236_104011 [Candidatus Kentron sp. FW]
MPRRPYECGSVFRDVGGICTGDLPVAPTESPHCTGNPRGTGDLLVAPTELPHCMAAGPTDIEMIYNPDIHHRRSIRLRGYDYSQAGAYFVTICTQNQECLFGKIADGEMRLNDAGKIVAEEWTRSEVIRDEIELDEWVVMPNHFHGILVITGRGDRRVAPTACGLPHCTGDRRDWWWTTSVSPKT